VILKAFSGTQAEFDALQACATVRPPKDLRFQCKFGILVPNYRDWKAGDIILSTPTPELRKVYHDWIVRKQKKTFPEQDAHTFWTHVAILAEDGCIWDMTPGTNVSAWTIGQFLQGSEKVQVRRYPGGSQPKNPFITILKSTVDHARYPKLPEIAYNFARDLVKLPAKFDEDVMYCSQYIETVIAHATEKPSFLGDDAAYPASFSRTNSLQTQNACWTRI
jgi:hypothetical protein